MPMTTTRAKGCSRRLGDAEVRRAHQFEHDVDATDGSDVLERDGLVGPTLAQPFVVLARCA